MNKYNPFRDFREETKMAFSLVQKQGPIVKADLVHLSGLTLSTLNRVMAPIELGALVIDSGEAVSSGGRKPHFYDVNKEKPLILGVEISRIAVRVALINLKIEVLESESFPMTTACTPEFVVSKVKGIAIKLAEKVNVSMKDIISVAIGTAGIIDREKGMIISAPLFPLLWDNVPIVALFDTEFDAQISLDNGANAAVVAEYLFGSGKDSEHVAYFHVGMGIRTGVINSGKLIRAINDKDDALAHMIVDIDGMECTCGNFGCVEAASSISAIMKRFISEVKKGRPSSITKSVEDVNIQDICEAAENGDELAKSIITDAGIYFGTGLSNYISLMNPHTVILSGPLVSYSPLFFRICTGVAMKKCFVGEESTLVFRRGCRYKDDAVVAGMAAMVIEEWIESGLV
ncbi:MAG: ROK family protein [Clostridia bacterium]